MRAVIRSGLRSAQQLRSVHTSTRAIRERRSWSAVSVLSTQPSLKGAQPSATLGQALSSNWGAKRRRLSSAASAAASDSGDCAPWLLVGLGNPGSKYEGNRHNIGFQFLDYLSSTAGISIDKKQHNAVIGRGRLWDRTVLLAKPQTYMNNSGKSVRKIVDYYKVLVIYDDIDLPTSKVRLRTKGSHGGQNGMRSIIAELGNTNEFPRLRIGIGRPQGKMAVADYVLQDFSGEQAVQMDIALREAEDIVKAIFVEGIDRAISGVRV